MFIFSVSVVDSERLTSYAEKFAGLLQPVAHWGRDLFSYLVIHPHSKTLISKPSKLHHQTEITWWNTSYTE